MVLIKPRSPVQARRGASTQLAEWSNAPDLRSGSFGSVGSNPTLCIGDLSPLVLLAQRIARETSNLEVVGSNPT